ncbi:hypothetical protein [Streptomyces sp. SID161]|uniref:hypothetical protein n=1 Tax=Streptomyces sp. SID161 TaxID=2690251 RepID=UPI001367C664|nr:hypothetical protein [Streptomyces sp. SID161]MYW15447.1 hypothetical protein [Streptomyces sp. SID2955]MYW47779.1 hypothetical protein [Streptomyces sp. SID161]
MIPKRTVTALVCGAVLAAAGCGSAHATVPADFCKVPVSRAALAPLIPDDGSVQQTYQATQAQPGAACALSAGGHRVLSVAIARWDRAPDPGDWKASAAPYSYAAERAVSFPGQAAIGSDGGTVRATCTSRTAYMTFGIYFFGDRVENSPTGYKKLQRFIDDFVPKQTRKFGCTR